MKTSAMGQKQKSGDGVWMSALGGEADINGRIADIDLPGLESQISVVSGFQFEPGLSL